VKVIPGHTRSKLNRDLGFIHLFVLLELVSQLIQFPLYPQTTASAARHIERSNRFVGWVNSETAGSFMQRLLAEEAATPLFDDVALDNNDVLFVRWFSHDRSSKFVMGDPTQLGLSGESD
jgi:hypothetical protein